MTDLNAHDIASRLIEGRGTLLELMKTIEFDLVSPDVSKRNDAIKFLSDILLRLPFTYPSDLEISTLIRFFTARLDTAGNDNASTSSGLKAIYYLTKCDQFNPDESLITVVNAILKDVDVQSLSQEARYVVLKLIQDFVGCFRKVLRGCESSFILGFMKAAEAEKDPRHLTIIFDTFLEITSTFTIDYLAEDLFELISCYFPVDFKQAPADEVHGVTPEKLTAQLISCLTSKNVFAPFCYQLIIDNFAECEYNLKPLIVLLEKALETFEVDQLRLYEEKLTFCLKSALLKSKTDDIDNDCIFKCIRRLVERSHKSFAVEQDNETVLGSVKSKSLYIFLNGAEHFLFNSDQVLRNVGLKLVSTLADLNALICQEICSRFIFLLLEKCVGIQLEFHIVCGEVLRILLCALARLHLSNLYMEYKGSLNPIVKSRLLDGMDIDVLHDWFSCATYMLHFDAEVFSDDELLLIIRKCADFLTRPTLGNNRPSITPFLQSIGYRKFRFIQTLYENLDAHPELRQLSPMFVVNDETATLCLPFILPPNFDFVEDYDKLSLQLELIENLMQCSEGLLNEEFKFSILLKIFHYVLKIYVYANDMFYHCDAKMFVRLADLAQDLMLEASSSGAESQLLDLMLPEVDGRVSHIRYSVLFDRILAAIAPQSTDRFIDTIDRILIVMDAFLESSDWEKNPDVQYYTFYGRCLASTVCKLEKNHPVMNRITQRYFPALAVKLKDCNAIVTGCFGFLCKALLMRNLTAVAGPCLQQMLEFTTSTGCPEALELVGGIFREDRRILNSRLHCICAPLYIQRVFTYCTTFFIVSTEKSTCGSPDFLTNKCRLLSLILSNVPLTTQTAGQIQKVKITSSIILEMSLFLNVLSILLDSLKPEHDSNILNVALNALEQFLSVNEDALVNKLSDYLPKLISLLSELTNKSDMVTLILR